MIKLIACLPLLLAGCTVTLVAPYDQKIDTGVTKMQTETENLLFEITSKSLPYKADYYASLRTELKVLQTRAAVLDNNQLTIQQLTLLGNDLNDLETLHKNNAITLADLTLIHDAFDASYSSILKLELAKKGNR